MGPRRVIEGQAAEVKRRERWEEAVKRRKSRRRNVGLLAANSSSPNVGLFVGCDMVDFHHQSFTARREVNLLTHKGQAKHSGGLSLQLFVHKFYSSCLKNGQIV